VKKFTLAALLIALVSMFGLSMVVHAQTEVELSAWTHDQLYLDYFTSRLEEWEAAHPDITFTYDFTVIPNSAEAFLQGLSAGEELPDLLGIEQGGFPNFMKNGVIASNFLDITDRVGDRRDEYAEGRWSIYSYEGRLFALESSLTASVMYYQPAIFEEHGIEVPTTWEEMLAAGDILGPEGISLSVATNNGNLFQMLLNQRDGQIFDEQGNFVLGDEPNRSLAIEVADFLQRAVANGTLFVVLGDDMWSGATLPTAYREGRLASIVMPDWWSTCCLQPGVEDMAGQWRVAAPPRWEGGGYGTLVWGGTGWAVNSQSPDAEIGWQFLEFMYMGVESQVQRFEQINMFPNMLEAAADPRVTSLTDPFYGDQAIGEIYAELAPEVPVWYQGEFRSNFLQSAADNLPLLFDGTMTPEGFVDEVISLTQDAIDFGF